MSWIKIEDQEPEHDQKVIIFSSETKDIAMAIFYNQSGSICWQSCGFDGWEWDWDFADYSKKYEGVTHWMPAPLPPSFLG